MVERRIVDAEGYSGIWSIVARVKAIALSQISEIGGGLIDVDALVTTIAVPDCRNVEQSNRSGELPTPSGRPSTEISGAQSKFCALRTL